jgi:hypothetical protein
MEIVNENTVLEVGKYYLVPCAKILSAHSDEFRCFVPILGEPHKDKQFSFDVLHYHVDGRFADNTGAYDVDDEGKTNKIVPFYKNDICREYAKEIVIKKRKCKRLTTGINPPRRGLSYNTSKYLAWYNSMIGKSCKGKKCPHLGITMHEHDGVLICPLHNLHGCIKTETIIKEK